MQLMEAAPPTSRNKAIKQINKTHQILINAAHRFFDWLEKNKVQGKGDTVSFKGETYLVQWIDVSLFKVELKGKSPGAQDVIKLDFIKDRTL